MLENQPSQATDESKEQLERSIGKTILIRVSCFAFCFLLIWQGYGLFEKHAKDINNVAGVEWVIPPTSGFDYDAKDAYVMKKDLEEIGLGLVTRQEKVKSGISSHYETYFGVEDKNGKVIIQPKYSNIGVAEEGDYILASYFNPKRHQYDDIGDVIHYYNVDGSDYVKGDYCEGNYFQDGYAVVGVPWSDSGKVYTKKKIFVIDQKGEVVYESPYNNVSNIPRLKGCFVVYNENLDMLADEKKGIVNLKGDILVPLEYDWIECNEAQQILYLMDYDEQGNEKLVGCMDYQFNPISVDELWKFRASHHFEYINPIVEGDAYHAHDTMSKEELFENARTVNEDENGWHIVDGNNIIIGDIPDCVKMYDFSEGVSVAEYENKIKYIDTNGNILFEINKVKGYDLEEEYGGNHFRDGMIEFPKYKPSFLGKDYQVGLLDKTGKVLLPAEFDYIGRILEDGTDQQIIVERNGNSGVVKIKKV